MKGTEHDTSMAPHTKAPLWFGVMGSASWLELSTWVYMKLPSSVGFCFTDYLDEKPKLESSLVQGTKAT